MSSSSRPPPSVTLSSSALASHRAAALGLTKVVPRKVLKAGAPPRGKEQNTGTAPAAPSLLSFIAANVACESCGARSAPSSSAAPCATCATPRTAHARPVIVAPSLAQRLGLVPAPAPALDDVAWAAVEARARARANNEEHGAFQCAICREAVALRACVLTSCGHVFHATCLASLSKFSGGSGLVARVCPLCREANFTTRLTRVAAEAYVETAVRTLQRAARGAFARAEAERRRWARYVEGDGTGNGMGGRAAGGGGAARRRVAFLGRALRSVASAAVRGAAAAAHESTRGAIAEADATLAAMRDALAQADARHQMTRAGGRREVTSSEVISGAPTAAASREAISARHSTSGSHSCGVSVATAALADVTSLVLGARARREAATRAAAELAVQSAAASERLLQAAAADADRERQGTSWPVTELSEGWEVRALEAAERRGEPLGDCCVCLAALAKGCALLSCGHVLHAACIQALEAVTGTKRICPLCREPYQRVDFQQRDNIHVAETELS